jgi:hypothetical protein
VNAKLAPKAEDAASAEPITIESTNLLFVFTIVVVCCLVYVVCLLFYTSCIDALSV